MPRSVPKRPPATSRTSTITTVCCWCKPSSGCWPRSTPKPAACSGTPRSVQNRVCTEPAANDKYVVVANGSVLYTLDRKSGRILWQRQLGGAPGAGPAMNDTHAFVPMVNGLIEGFNLEKVRQAKRVELSLDRPHSRAAGVHDRVGWLDDRKRQLLPGRWSRWRHSLPSRNAQRDPLAPGPLDAVSVCLLERRLRLRRERRVRPHLLEVHHRRRHLCRAGRGRGRSFRRLPIRRHVLPASLDRRARVERAVDHPVRLDQPHAYLCRRSPGPSGRS